MSKEKRKQSPRRLKLKYLWIVVGILIFIAVFAGGFQLGYELNNDELQNLTRTQYAEATQSPMNILEITQQAVNTEIVDLLSTMTVIVDIQNTLEPDGESSD